jgi:hypothetical protein
MISQEPLGQGFGGDDEVDPQSQGYDCYEHHAGFRRVAHDAALDVYRKWNYKLFVEMRTAYKQRSSGRGRPSGTKASSDF